MTNCQNGNVADLAVWPCLAMDKEWLKSKLIERGRGSQRELARVLGKDTTVVNKLVNGPRKITDDEGVKIRAWISSWGKPAQASLLEGRTPARSADPEPPDADRNKPDVPVWASVSAGDADGTMIMTDRPIDWIRRSDAILHVPDPFAFFIVGDSMEDRFYQGDQAVVRRTPAPRPGDDCVFIQHAADGAIYGLVKRLLRSTADAWQVRQLNPRKDFSLPKKKWAEAYRIVETRHRSS